MKQAVLLMLALAAVLTGCATKERVVNVPVLVPCLGAAPTVPVYRFGSGAYPGDTQAAKLLAADLLMAKQYSVELRAQMAGCK